MAHKAGGGAIRVINKAGGRGVKSDQCDKKKTLSKVCG